MARFVERWTILHPCIQLSYLCVFQNHQVCVVVSDEELEMQFDSHFSTQYLDHFGVLVFWLIFLLKNRKAICDNIQNLILHISLKAAVRGFDLKTAN